MRRFGLFSGWALIALFTVSLSSANAQTRRRAEPRLTTETPRDVAADTSMSASSVGGTTFWLGAASAFNVTRTTYPALSLLVGLSDTLAIQTYAVIPDTSPFIFSLGANLKATLIGDIGKGFHIGAGVGVGTVAASPTTTNFFTNINGFAGLHFQMVDRVMASIDFGPTLGISNNQTTFTLAGDPALSGISLLFRL